MKCVPRLWTRSSCSTASPGSLKRVPRLYCCTVGFSSVLSMMLMPEAPAPGRMKPVKGSANVGANGGTLPVAGIEEEDVAGAHLDRQRAPVEAALERHDLERDPVVVEAEAAVQLQRRGLVGPGEAEPRAEVVEVASALALVEGRHDRVGVGVARDVLDVGVELVAQAEVERELGRQPPVVLHEGREVVAAAVVEHQVLVGLAAPERDREQAGRCRRRGRRGSGRTPRSPAPARRGRRGRHPGRSAP